MSGRENARAMQLEPYLRRPPNDGQRSLCWGFRAKHRRHSVFAGEDEVPDFLRHPDEDTIHGHGHVRTNHRPISPPNSDVRLSRGRRRGRRSHGKNETLPEESSFLCEPDLSSEILVKDCSYIENFFEVNRQDEDTKTDGDKKPRRRNSGRKSRRKKNKISPAKDMLPNAAWHETVDLPETLNNQSAIPKICDEKIGKNVNDLKADEDYKKSKRKDNVDSNGKDKKDAFADRVYNVIDKLEKVGIKDDMYLAGDFNAEDLESDFFYSSDDMDEFCDDT
ncbi:jg11972 [Pararge aegeria aegeria]|uniref:Jg11972 protein n=1 Tax=Pararge aegeria aegeria TaxID=348720 RepID=A0A8S4S910_9NEOP|nr:jg11972 [Pararge aegeria aegeria]